MSLWLVKVLEKETVMNDDYITLDDRVLALHELPTHAIDEIERACARDPWGLMPQGLVDVLCRSLQTKSLDHAASWHMVSITTMTSIDRAIKAKAS